LFSRKKKKTNFSKGFLDYDISQWRSQQQYDFFLPQNSNDSTHPDTTPTSTAQAHTYR